ncbi:phospho-N-acetylmuramoyl-pentapeptide-transferase [Trichothermofontia sp.]
MDAKLFPSRSLVSSGLGLSFLLAIVLGLAAIVSDTLAGRSATQFGSLTLPLLLSAGLTVATGLWVVPLLQALKTGQIIREEGPKAHFKKAGTPTMGGIFILPVGLCVALLAAGLSPQVWVLCLLTLAFGAIGWLDDWQVLHRRSNRGISPRTKLLLQITTAFLFCIWLLATQPAMITTIALPLGLTLPLGTCFWAVAGFVLVAESNATNLTDGLDGLAAGTGAIALLAMGILIGSTAPDLMVFCAALSGAYLGFLAHNRNPASVFMGDTGSLALGGALAGVALLSQNLWGLLIIGGLFVAEALSVVLQVSYYKATKGPNGIGKRLFKMAPLHHHLELTGWSELQVVLLCYIAGGLLALLGLSLRAGIVA